jgi:hypothetical protein
MRLGTTAAKVGKGLFAGFVGTAAMTVSSTIEMQLRGRPASMTPANAAMKVLGLKAESEADKEHFSTLVHWAYGTGWGAARGLIEANDYHGDKATALHFIAVWGTALLMLPGLKVTPPVDEWGTDEIAIDAFHHFVYVTATALAYALLDRE